jgi:hypothetical protein
MDTPNCKAHSVTVNFSSSRRWRSRLPKALEAKKATNGGSLPTSDEAIGEHNQGFISLS